MNGSREKWARIKKKEIPNLEIIIFRVPCLGV